MLARRAVRRTPREQLPTFSQPRVKSFRFRSYVCDAIPAFASPLDSALTKRDACNSFRIRSYEKHGGVTHLFSQNGTSTSFLFHQSRVTNHQSRALKFFLCHTSRISPATPLFATDPKIPPRKSFPCHTCDTPGGLLCHLVTRNRFKNPAIHPLAGPRAPRSAPRTNRSIPAQSLRQSAEDIPPRQKSCRPC